MTTNLNSPARAAMIGCGGMARHHLRGILQGPQSTQFLALCDPSPDAYAQAALLFTEAGFQPPPNVATVDELLERFGSDLEAVFIITPHSQHFQQASQCLKAGLDVLLEKPMVMTADEAIALIKTQRQSGNHLVVAFNGSLSPQVRKASQLIHSGSLGELLTIHAGVWQGWKHATTNTWRQQPAISGGGYLFDTGAHLLNTVVDLAGQPVVEVSAYLDPRGSPVDIVGAVLGKLQSGAMITLNGCGDMFPTLGSDVRVFCTDGILRTGVWGERLQLQRPGQPSLRTVRVAKNTGPWDQFLRVRRGETDNPCPPEVGLRMALLWDAIQASARSNGASVTVQSPPL